MERSYGSDPGSPGDQTKLLERVALALECARTAVAFDSESKYAQALLNYREAATILVDNSDDAPLEHQSTMLDLARQYESRIKDLEKSIPSLSGLKKIQPSNSGHFLELKEEVPVGVVPPKPPPRDPMMRPFWLMKVLLTSMLGGSYVTPDVYVPRIIWFQSCKKLPAVHTKLHCCDMIVDALHAHKREARPAESDAVVRDRLDTILVTFFTAQNMLAKSLSFIREHHDDDSKKEKSLIKKMGDIASKTAGKIVSRWQPKGDEDSTATYPNALCDVFEHTLIIERWVEQYASHPEIGPRLKHASDFLLNVVCAWVVRDMHFFISRYLRQIRRSFERSAPT
eukprot:TRINITY_DN6652_c0_g4_i1.p1 TRINITY_DN6652_c0_g4~~TRINITY_DN6652_c0_g4_i1.p1  ORF type:complete len:353 (-),score=71.03 TRINITY_DN6652_c0_g4_i1:320-1339(-)